jgi:septal ring factor EnvC (AmiA/AmiB activator)
MSNPRQSTNNNGAGALALILKVALPVATGVVVPVLLAIIPWMMRVQASLAQLGEQIANVSQDMADHQSEHARLWQKIDALERQSARLDVQLAALRRAPANFADP